MTPAEQVKAIRDKLGETDASLAERLGVNRATVWRWIEGKSPVSPSTLRALRALRKRKRPTRSE